MRSSLGADFTLRPAKAGWLPARRAALAGEWRVGDLQPTRRTIGRAENVEVPPFVEVLFSKNFPKIAAIFGDLMDRVAVSGDGPVQCAALLTVQFPIDLDFHKRLALRYQTGERLKDNGFVSLSIDFYVPDFRNQLWIHPFQERLQILALHPEFECVPVQPFAHSFKPSAVAVSRIRVPEFHFRIFGSRREHQWNDVRRRRVQLRVFLQYGKDVAIRLQGENATRFAN